MLNLKNFKTHFKQYGFILRTLKSLSSSKVTESNGTEIPIKNRALNALFKSNAKIENLKNNIPRKYFKLKACADHLYLIDPDVAEDSVGLILPDIKNRKYIAETNAGLGLITKQLIDNGIKKVHMYETCPLFREQLNKLVAENKNVKLNDKDLFKMDLYKYLDTKKNDYIIPTILEQIPKTRWKGKPSITIIGAMPNLKFIIYLITSLATQTGLMTHGRIELFAYMRPKDYLSLTATPNNGLTFYRSVSILFQSFFSAKLIGKYPRNVFLPLRTAVKKSSSNIDKDFLYFVHVETRKDLPLSFEEILPFYHYVSRFYGRGKNRVVPTIESWVPGCGSSVVCSGEIGIFTEFGELNPEQILQVYQNIAMHPSYSVSSFKELMETEAMKYETVEL